MKQVLKEEKRKNAGLEITEEYNKFMMTGDTRRERKMTTLLRK